MKNTQHCGSFQLAILQGNFWPFGMLLAQDFTIHIQSQL